MIPITMNHGSVSNQRSRIHPNSQPVSIEPRVLVPRVIRDDGRFDELNDKTNDATAEDVAAEKTDA